MRSQLFVAGVIVGGTGAASYVLQIPLMALWSIPFMAGGGLMIVASLFLSESHGPVQPPEGYRFCAYCGNPVKLDQARCERCNGFQPGAGEA